MLEEKEPIRKKRNEKNLEFPNQSGDEQEFKAKSEDEVIKVPKCTYANDVKILSTFFFCQCSSEEDFYPICDACAQKCHKKHNPALKIDGIYTCMCGKCNHVITKENERRLKEKRQKLQNICFFNKFFDVTPNKGYFLNNNVIHCAVCVQFCLQKKLEDPTLQSCNDDQGPCQCEKHYEINVINLNVDLISKPKFNLNLQNFNFNILSHIPATRQMYIDYLIAKVSEYEKSPTYEMSKTFFTNPINFKILELFSAFAVRWENKFFHVQNYLNVSDDLLFKLVAFSEPIRMLSENDAADFVTAKFYFAEYVFNYIVRTYQLKFNNLWNVRTILNMNIYQRFIYLQEIKNFFKFNYDDYENLQSNENIFLDLANNILDIYENILKVNENFDFMERILSYVFPTFNRIFKYLIKYNIVDEATKSRYFELVLDSINMANEREGNSKLLIFNC